MQNQNPQRRLRVCRTLVVVVTVVACVLPVRRDAAPANAAPAEHANFINGTMSTLAAGGGDVTPEIQDVGWHILRCRGWRDRELQYRSLPAAYLHNAV
jgi:hypothetical protein